MRSSVILLIILGVISGGIHGANVLPDSVTAVVGGTVTFTTTVTPPQTPFLVVTWSFTNAHDATSNVITSSQAHNATAPAYTDRIRLFRSTGSLELSGLTVSDTGVYKVALIPDGAAQVKGSCRLLVHVPVTNVTVSASNTEVLEFGSVRLSCSSSGSSLSFLWLNGSSEVTASDRVQLTDGGSALTIHHVTRCDRGPFRCHVTNPVSNGTSDPVNLLIILGPENTTLTMSPLQEYYAEGSDVSLTCSAVSGPAAHFLWFVNGHRLTDTGAELRLKNIQMSQSGNYTCLAVNNRTMRNQTSHTAVVTVLTSHISDVVITPNTTDLSEFSSSVSLSCSSSGSFPSFLWLNDTSQVTASDRVLLSDGGATLTIVRVTRYDQGPYQCHVFNNFSNSTSEPLKLSISFGPENINLKLFPSQQFYEEGSNVTLICSAVSRPGALYHWFLNGDQLPYTGAELRLMNIEESHSGNYSCQAFNNKTMRHETSQPSALSVLVQVSDVVVTSNTTEVLEFTSVRLSCSSSGSSLSFLWFNGSSEVTASDRVQLTDGGSALTIRHVTRYDRGPFRCNVSNGVSDGISKSLRLVIKYGPDHVTIIGPKSVPAGDLTVLYCSTESVPAANFTWLFRGKPTYGHEVVHIIQSSQDSDSGTYTCTAENTVTGRSHTTHHEFTVTDSSDCGCSSAAGLALIITAGVCLIIAVVTGISACVVVRGKRVNSNYPLYQQGQCLLHLTHRIQTSYIGMCMGEGVLPQGPLHGAVGGSVRFTTNLSPSEKPFSTVSWRFSNTSSAVSFNIITSSMSNNYTEHGYNNRISLDRATGGLDLRDLRLEDSGEYTLTIIPEGQLILGRTTLKVYEPIKDVRVESWMNPPREGHPYMLTCNMSGFPEMIHWIKTRMQERSEIGGVFDVNNRTITFNPLKRNDTGDYKCMAANPLGNMTSLTDKLHVNFGPDAPVFHGPAFVEEGRFSTFTCSAVSVPPGQFSWWFNGTEVADTSVFRTKPFTFNMSGEYTCMAHNRVTTKNSTKSKMVTVIEAIESVMIHHDTLPINSENFTLSCEVTGPYDAIYWTKDDTLLNMNASASDTHMNVHTVNNTLLFTPVTVDDDGTYQCFATNKAARHGSQQYKLLVNYGPVSVSITGPDPVTSDSSRVSLTCSADSQPDCDFSWFFNNDTSAVSQSGSVITFSATKDNEGKYTCEATNPVTNISVYKSAAYNGHTSALHFSPRAGLTLTLFALCVSMLLK
ncbi:hemicentin-1-like [Solea solea]|uniref:hemicentin-1-like n=1 Tax=Solea solea TaxID=90069 RepID=UPI00272A483A|nr:hemicentin-1-like [Solea solea]